MPKLTDNNSINLPLITSYGNNFIKINNSIKIEYSTLLFSDGTYQDISKVIKSINTISINTLRELFNHYHLDKDIFLVGCGNKYLIPNYDIRCFIKNSGFSLEWMITQSAIHTWNILLEDYRDVIFLLIWEN